MATTTANWIDGGIYYALPMRGFVQGLVPSITVVFVEIPRKRLQGIQYERDGVDQTIEVAEIGNLTHSRFF